jgi:hypothetical protein
MGEELRSLYGMNIPDYISESLETIFSVKILKCFDADPGSEMEKLGFGIRGKHLGSATLVKNLVLKWLIGYFTF